ncbi:MAG: hypothetical protein JNL70_02490 [Saprospiraceae bacterium]|nr:hypothetical protein [Saprospiraceae bacterium]
MAKKSLLSGKLQSEKAKASTELSPEQVEQAFQQLTTAKATPSVIEPLMMPEKAADEPKTRLSIDIPKDMHRKLKKKIVDTDQTIMQYVVALIDKDLQEIS